MDSSNLLMLSHTPPAAAGELKSDRNPNIGDKTPGREISFQDVLRNITKQDKKDGKEKEPGLKEIKSKIDEIEKKIAALESKGSTLKNPEKIKSLHELKSILEEINKLIASMKDNKTATDAGTGISGLPVMSFINQVLEQIISMLDKQDLGGNLNTLELIKNKLDGMLSPQAAAGFSGTNSKTSNEEQKSPGFQNGEKDNTDGKVIVTDKRTKPGEAGSVTTGDIKENKKAAEQFSGLGSMKIEATQDKAGILQSMKASEKDQGDKSMFKEFAAAQTNKADLAAQPARVALNYSLPLNRAGLEALMQNITGRALVTLKDGKSELKMNLIPPELGKMSMKFVLEGGRMTGQIVVSTPEAKMIFDQNLGELQRSLEQAGINIGSLNVSLSGQGGQENTEDSLNNFNGGIPEEKTPEIERAYKSLFNSSINYLA